MLSDLYWIDAGVPLKLAIMARPRAGDGLEDEVANWKRQSLAIVVSLLERDEVEELGLEAEALLCASAGLDYRSFPIPDRSAPDTEDAMLLAAELASGGRPVAIHCRAGIGRSSIMAAAVLVRLGVGAEAALTAIGAARRLPIPDTEAQRAWVLALDSP